MRLSQSILRTSRENPAQESARNAQLLIRAGYINKTMAGVYSFNPIGLKVLRRIENIVREEMNRVGGQELFLPALAPQEPWQQTKRWDTVDVLYKLDLSSGGQAALCPTHEETVTPLVQDYCRSYKDLPQLVYQIQTKFRNEPRAKSGLLRGREFLMKDAYSFHLSQKDFEAWYEVLAAAYERIYQRLGIGDCTFRVKASGGDFSEFSDEFQTLSERGEDEVFCVPSTREFWNKEIAPATAPQISAENPLPYQEVKGPGVIGVEDLVQFLGVPAERTTKTIFFQAEKDRLIAAVVRGTHEINELKLSKVVGQPLTLASEAAIKKATGAQLGYAGLVNLPDSIELFCDDSVAELTNFETGTNRTDYHAMNVNWERDVPRPEKFYEFKTAQKGDAFPPTGEKYEVHSAVEVGNIFPLSTKFSEPFKFQCLDEKGVPQPVIMGCYGIGISRLMGVLAELFSDEKGLKWPAAVAPYEVYLCPIGKEPAVEKIAEELYEKLQAAGQEVLFDDRTDKKIGAGQKLADHELLGIPQRLVISARTLEQFSAEISDRLTGENKLVPLSEWGLKEN